MKSEPETDALSALWQGQPLPAATAETEARALQAVEATEAQARKETGPVAWWVALLLLAPITAGYVLLGSALKMIWTVWLILAYLWAMVAVAAVYQRLMVRCEQEFGTSLLGRIEGLRTRLRFTLKWGIVLHVTSALASAIVIVAIQPSNGSSRLLVLALMPLSLYVGATTFLRKRKAHQQQLSELEAMRRELTG